MKKFISTALAFMLSLGCVAAVGCGGGDTGDDEGNNGAAVVNDEKTVNLRLYKAGFGDAFIYELKKNFEAVYAEEGYKINVLTPTYGSAGTAMVQEMSRGYDKTGVDLYITGAITPNMVSEYGEYGLVCEELEESVWNQTAINYDGTESETVISERILSDYEPFLRADNGKMYGFNWAQTTAGLVVNTKKLSAYGVTELPRTTNELFDVFDKILYGVEGLIGGSEETKTYPVTYTLKSGVGGGAGYQDCAMLSWFSQYDIDTYNEFLRMQHKTEDGWVDMEEGYKVFENESLLKSLTAGFEFMDMEYSAYGSKTQTLDQAQGLLMKEAGRKQNNAVFMLNGDWFLNEVKANYSKYLHDITFMNVPVISSLGIDVFGAATSYNLSDEACDELLSYICKLVDENKTIEEIIASVKTEKGIDLTQEDAQRIATARGVGFARGIEHLAFMTKDTTKKHIASLVLRMMASDDFAETFMVKANASSPYTKDVQAVSEYKFVNDAQKITSNIHYRAVNSRMQGVRFKAMRTDAFILGTNNLALTLYDKNEKDSYADAAKKLFDACNAKALAAWNEYIKD